MEINAKYDVFISYSRKDYIDEKGNPIEGNAISELLSLLEKNDVSYWFDKNGIYGGSAFVEIITKAITESKMLIFVSSKHSNSSPWTTGEIFEALAQKKHIIPYKIDNSPYNVKYRMMLHPLDYIEQYVNAQIAQDSLLKAITSCKAKYEELIKEEEIRKAEEKIKQQKAVIIKEINEKKNEYQYLKETLDTKAQELVEKQIIIGNNEKKCPVCGAIQYIGNKYCEKCGWTFYPIFEENPQGDTNHIFLMQSIFKRANVKIENISDKVRKLNVIWFFALVCVSLCLSGYFNCTSTNDPPNTNDDSSEVDDKSTKELDKDLSIGNVSYKFIKVEEGTFVLGGNSRLEDSSQMENPPHKVTLSSYYIGETEVTQDLWNAVMGENINHEVWDNQHGIGGEYPAYNVSWEDCMNFITRLNEISGKKYRLPTEAEWEFAARGGNKSNNTLYSGSNKLDDVAWYDRNSQNKDYGTHHVKTKQPNELGVYDMSGNVWEWCDDWYGVYSSAQQKNPTGPADGSSKVCRGGSWNEDAKYCSSCSRSFNSPVSRYSNLGFRLVFSE